MQTIGSIIKKNKILQLLDNRVVTSLIYDEYLATVIKNYTTAYLEANNVGLDPGKIYSRFIRNYNRDMAKFAETGKYPLEIDAQRKALERYDYNIVLLFSCLFSVHRFRIMQLIDGMSLKSSNGLFIGCGPGLELELVKAKIDNLYAYDLTIDSFLLAKHPEVQFREEYFTGENASVSFDCIYLIELLEHLEKPYDLLERCRNVLSHGGKIYLTTATNIPQFDHLYNFESGHEIFEEKIQALGLSIEYMEEIMHQSLTLDIGAKNRFYILTLKN